MNFLSDDRRLVNALSTTLPKPLLLDHKGLEGTLTFFAEYRERSGKAMGSREETKNWTGKCFKGAREIAIVCNVMLFREVSERYEG